MSAFATDASEWYLVRTEVVFGSNRKIYFDYSAVISKSYLDGMMSIYFSTFINFIIILDRLLVWLFLLKNIIFSKDLVIKNFKFYIYFYYILFKQNFLIQKQNEKHKNHWYWPYGAVLSAWKVEDNALKSEFYTNKSLLHEKISL